MPSTHSVYLYLNIDLTVIFCEPIILLFKNLYCYLGSYVDLRSFSQYSMATQSSGLKNTLNTGKLVGYTEMSMMHLYFLYHCYPNKYKIEEKR